ncbi:MAG: hypothetical protein LH614_19180 [Pyrinomonadaceae bacterium]|nr:hypothetical protein [Pyrinomonadaceae bacterium]
MKNKKFIWLLVIGSILLLGGSAFIVKRVFFYRYLKEVVLSENVVITSEWKEVGNQDLLKITKEINYISILVRPPLTVDTPKGGIKTPESSIINPETKIVDDEGHEYSLSFGGSRQSESGDFANYRYVKDLPVDKRYSKILIRSDNPIQAKQIIWTGYNAKDLP